jgi:hypothetical protein
MEMLTDEPCKSSHPIPKRKICQQMADEKEGKPQDGMGRAKAHLGVETVSVVV